MWLSSPINLTDDHGTQIGWKVQWHRNLNGMNTSIWTVRKVITYQWVRLWSPAITSTKPINCMLWLLLYYNKQASMSRWGITQHYNVSTWHQCAHRVCDPYGWVILSICLRCKDSTIWETGGGGILWLMTNELNMGPSEKMSKKPNTTVNDALFLVVRRLHKDVL